jgi:GNAT superfamily N-acetyltransferase
VGTGTAVLFQSAGPRTVVRFGRNPVASCPVSDNAAIVEMAIRQVRLEDVASLQRNCFSLNTVDQTTAKVEAALAKAREGEGTSFVAVRHGEVLGHVSVTRNTHCLQRHRAHLGGFVIRPTERGQGLARRLTSAAARWAADQSCTMLEADCRGGTHAEEVYRALGFREWGRLSAGFVEEAGTFDQVCFFSMIENWLERPQAKST